MRSVAKLIVGGAFFLLSYDVLGAGDAAVKAELVPTGTLRVAVAVSPAPSALYVVEDPATKSFRGVAVDLGKLLAAKLKVPVAFVPYRASGEITASADANVWDVTFMPVDDTRRKAVSFGNAFHVLQSTYLVAAGTNIGTVADANRAGVKIAGVANTTTLRASSLSAPSATHVTVASVDEAVAAVKAKKAVAVALSRESLSGLAGQLPGSRILGGGFHNTTTAIAVPKNKPAALAYVSAFIEEAKTSGAVRRAFDDIGLTIAVVAGPGAKP
jgi:polar amino acid transport system substrate-binding protein